MTEIVLLATPYPRLITQGVRSDFRGTMSLITRVNRLLNAGFPTDFGTRWDGPLEFAGLNLTSSFHSYSGIQSTRELTTLLPLQYRSVARAFAFGNILGLVFSNASQNIVQDSISRFRSENGDSWMKTLLGNELLGQVFQSYVGVESVRQDPSQFPLAISSYLTTFLCMIICNSDEFKMYQESSESLELRAINNVNILIGKHGGSNFVEPAFPGISINPIIIEAPQAGFSHIYYDVINGLLNTTMALGELYNLHSLTEDLMEVAVIAESEVVDELSSSARPSNPFNPTQLWKGFGLKELAGTQEAFGSVLLGPIGNIRRYRTVSSQLLWKQEGVPHYEQVAELLSRVDGASPHVADKIIVSTKAQWLDIIRGAFYDREKLFDNLKEPINNLVKSIENALGQARTTLSLNIAVAALAWSIPLAIIGPIISPPLFSFLSAVLSKPEGWLVIVGVTLLSFTRQARLGVRSLELQAKRVAGSRVMSDVITTWKATAGYVHAGFGLTALILATMLVAGWRSLSLSSVILSTLLTIEIVGITFLLSCLTNSVFRYARREKPGAS